MAFNTKIINQVKEKAAFKCCRCESIGIEVHHIIPQKDNGPDTFENAAPLCPNCHAAFGDNPIKRKEITQMRDWWYKVVDKRYSTSEVNYKLLNEINSKVEALATNQDKALVELKETLKKAAFESIEQMTAGTARATASGIANATIVPYYKVGISEILESADYASVSIGRRVKCPKCGTLGQISEPSLTSVLLYPKHYKCETCGTEFE